MTLLYGCVCQKSLHKLQQLTLDKSYQFDTFYQLLQTDFAPQPISLGSDISVQTSTNKRLCFRPFYNIFQIALWRETPTSSIDTHIGNDGSIIYTRFFWNKQIRWIINWNTIAIAIGDSVIILSHILIVARLSKSLSTLTLGSSKLNQHCWRFHGSGVIAAPQIIGLISFCIGTRHEYFLRSSMCFRVSHLCSKIPKINNWTEEFATVIWRLHCFTVSFRGDVRGESGPR